MKMMRHPEHHHVPTAMQRNRINMQQMGPPPQRMLMTVPPGPAGVLVSMPSALINPITPIQQHQPKTNAPQVFYDPINNEATEISVEPAHTQQAAAPQPPAQKQSLPNTTTSSNVPNLANMKEKTPMCLVNELARYNKIQHQYKLTGEQGPDHKKIFTVTLRLDTEEYEAEGERIKKAQQAAAALALQKTKLQRPPPKNNRNLRPGGMRTNGNGVMTPTVELNALAMKRGERTTYIIESGLPQLPQGYMVPYYGRQNMYTPRYNYDARRNPNVRGQYQYDNRYHNQYRPNFHSVNGGGEICSVRLRVGDREYQGTGTTIQAARHDAASKAIIDIKKINDETGDAEKTKELQKEETDANENSATLQEFNTDLKSPISLVHEIALRRHLNVVFEVKSESGQPHMKEFVTICKIDEVMVEGEGNGKKISKKRAAEKMLQKLAQLPPLPPSTNPQVKKKRATTKKKARNLIKVNANETAKDINPICRLMQIQQANKEQEPTYTLVDERVMSRHREFIIEASVNGVTAWGFGPNKKMAKRHAAEALLSVLGYAPSTNPNACTKMPAKLEEKADGSASDKPRKVTFLEDKQEATVGGSGGRQLVPGLLLVNDQSSHNKTKSTGDSTNPTGDSGTTNNSTAKKVTVQKLQPSPQGGVRSKDKLLYLAQLMNIQAQFSDFPKANHEMYLTLVSLSTNPPQVCHGEGPTIEASHEKAALEALNVLSEMGLDNIPPSKDLSTEQKPNIKGLNRRKRVA